MKFRLLMGLVLLNLGACSMEPESSFSPPWDVLQSANQNPIVFDVTIGESKLVEVEKMWHRKATLALFEDPDGKLVVEAYFDKLNMGGIQGKPIALFNYTDEQLEAIRSRAFDRKPTKSGAWLMAIDKSDQQALYTRSIDHLVFVPGFTGLEETDLLQRFGTPAQRLNQDEGRSIWFYPDHSMAISYDPNGKEVIHYVAASGFESLSETLKNK